MSEVPTARELLEGVAGYVDDPLQPKSSADRPVRLATVDAAYAGGKPKVTFDGETVMGSRTYACLRPVAAGQRVVMLPVGHTYVVLGAVLTEPVATGALLFHAVANAVSTTNNVFAVPGTSSGSTAWDELYDPYGLRSVSNPTRVVPKVPGWYETFVMTSWASNLTGARALGVNKNGVLVPGSAPQVSAADNSGGNHAGVAHVSMNGTTDYLEATARQTSGGALTLDTIVFGVKYLRGL